MNKGKTPARALCLTLLLCLLLAAAAPGAFADWNGSYQDAQRSVVSILGDDGIGSGFGVGRAGEPTDLYITNRHVVVREDGRLSENVYIMLGDGAVTYYFDSYGYYLRSETDESLLLRCEVLYPREGDPEYPDVAVLRAERILEDHAAVPLKSGFDIRPGETVYAMGYPGSADDFLAMEPYGNGYRQRVSAGTDSVTVTQGIVSRRLSLGMLGGTTVFQHTAQINHGNSGGPLVTADGYVVGINTYGFNTADNGVAEYYCSLLVDYAMQKLDALGLDYDRYDAQTEQAHSSQSVQSRTRTVLPAVLCALGAAALIAVTLVLLKKRKRADWQLRGISGVYAGRCIPVKGALRLGRDPGSCNLLFPPDTRGVSGSHCRLEERGGALELTDSGSSYGTFLNGLRLKAEAPAQLSAGDVFFLADEKNCFCVEKGGKK